MQGRSTLTQKMEPLLCQIQPNINLRDKILTLSVPWMKESCSVALNLALKEVQGRQLCSGKVCGDKIDGIDCGDEISEWLELALGLTGLRMIQLTQRKSKVQNNLQSLANEGQFLVLNRSSAKELFEQSQENLEPDQNLDWMLEQFRGNIVVDGCNPYEENDWKKLEIVGQNLILDVNGLCTRCNVIGVNQANSERVQEPLQTLAKSESKRFKFGILAGSDTSMEGLILKIGNEVKAE